MKRQCGHLVVEPTNEPVILLCHLESAESASLNLTVLIGRTSAGSGFAACADVGTSTGTGVVQVSAKHGLFFRGFFFPSMVSPLQSADA